MDVTAAIADDVSNHAPAIGLRGWVSGARPVLGAIAACSLMLLACSWFALSSGALGPRDDVGRPSPVRIDGPASPDRGIPARPASSAARPARVDVGARPAQHGGAAAAAPELRQSSEAGPEPVTPSTRGPVSAGAEAPSPRAAAPPTAAVASPVPPVAPPSLPAPVDDLPNVSVPPVTLPDAIQDLSVPAVPAVTSIFGAP